MKEKQLGLSSSLSCVSSSFATLTPKTYFALDSTLKAATMGGGPAIIAKAQPVPKSVDSNLTEDMLDSNKGVALSDQANYVNPIDETAVHGDVGVTATKGIIGFVISEESTGR